MKLKIRLEVWETTVLLQVLEQSDKDFKEYKAKNGLYIIKSGNQVIALGKDFVGLYCVETRTLFENAVSTLYFETPQQAIDYKDKVLEALTEFVEYMNGKPEKSCCLCPYCKQHMPLKNTMTQDGNVYSFGG